MYKKITIILFALILVALPILTFIMNPSDPTPFSENENRNLARFPTLNLNNIEDKDFMQNFDTWFSDRFALRETWIQAKHSIERISGEDQINGTYTVNNQMMQAWSGYDKESVDKSLKAINLFAENNSNVPVYMMLAPTSIGIYGDEYIAAGAPLGNQQEFINYCYSSLNNIKSIDVFSALSVCKDNYIYYRTDHHWTSLGAYLAYSAAAATLNYTALPLNNFEIEHASSEFRGTLFSKNLDFGVTPDVIDYYTPISDSRDITVTVMTNGESKEYKSMYFRDYLEVKDKYSSFLGTNSPYVKITNNNAKTGKKLLIFKDSYCHCLAPFLINNYDEIVLLDMRYINRSYKTMVDVEDYSQVLFMYNVITFSEDTNIRKLNMGN